MKNGLIIVGFIIGVIILIPIISIIGTGIELFCTISAIGLIAYNIFKALVDNDNNLF